MITSFRLHVVTDVSDSVVRKELESLEMRCPVNPYKNIMCFPLYLLQYRVKRTDIDF